MGAYPEFTDDQLLAEIAEMRKAIRTVGMGGGVAVVQGEGRRLEMTRPDMKWMQSYLRELLFEARDRGLPVAEAGGAIAVEIG